MLPPEIYQQVRQIQVQARRLVDGIFAGEYHSVFKGHGMEFAEVREYAPGDDIRTIDWNVTARLGQPFVKKYIEERELTVMLLVDVSASGAFGSRQRSKAEMVNELCALLALSATRNNDKVGLILFTDRVEKFIAPQKGRTRALRIIRELLAFEPASSRTDIAVALDYLHKVCQRHSVTFLISDFLGKGFERSLRIAHQRHDVIPISVNDPHEASLPKVGLVTLQDIETGEYVLADTNSAKFRRAFEQRRRDAVERRKQLFRSLRLDFVDLRSDQPYLNPLIRFFRLREQRLWAGR